MTKKLAIVISGAVSLGSYEAGVTYEVLEAIAQHNTECDPEDRIEIDVITGASAGGITATILAKALLCHGEVLREPYKNPLFKAWVEKVKMVREGPADPNAGLLEVDEDSYAYSLLNTKALDQIAKEILPDSFGECSKDCPVGKAHPTVSRNENGVSQVVVGLSLGNLNGFPLSIRLNQDNNENNDENLFSYSQYKDNFVFRISRPSKEPVSDLALEELASYATGNPVTRTWKPLNDAISKVTWAQLREITLSTGAFPFAFAVRKIDRHSDQSKNPQSVYASRDSTRKADAFRRSQQSDPFDGKYIYTDGGVFENEPIGLAFSLIESLYEGKETHGVNGPDRYFLFIAPGSRKASSDPFRSYRRDDKTTGNSNNDPDHILVAKALASAIMGQSRFQEWIAQENQAKVLAITSKDSVLLGDVFSAFGGFLDIKFRAYDYNMGREAAQLRLSDLAKEENPLIQDYNSKPIGWMEGKAVIPSLTSAWMPGNGNSPKTWEAAKSKFESIAKTSTKPDGERDQIQELKQLLEYVPDATRNVIRDQLLARVSSLILYFYEKLEEPGPDPESRPRKSMFANLGFWAKAVWALARGRYAVAAFAKNQVDLWLRSKIDL